MREWLKKHRKLSLGRWSLGAGLLVAGFAWASPWDIDMIDGVNFKAYEWKMRPPFPEGAVQRRDGTVPRAGGVGVYQNDYIPDHDRMTGSDTLTNPYGAADEATLATGKQLFQVSCAPCHGVDGTGNGPVTTNDPAKGLNRFPVPAPILSGPGAVSPMRTDGYIYLTVRNGGTPTGNGGTLMPAYGVSLTDRERWAVVSYIRTLEGAQYVPPNAPAPTDGAPADGAATPAPGTGDAAPPTQGGTQK